MSSNAISAAGMTPEVFKPDCPNDTISMKFKSRTAALCELHWRAKTAIRQKLKT